ncbi:alpha/beta fold hydrolase [Aliiglaciecola sp. CAU 1673]|uniref:alpha/beta hydrolase n=1 Tax=Aliiglaciecola sp. CAU 1673 TaxID=3032595 RepID=UPI0023DAA9F2|nr:alpha/beta fold hydrolase [Aliiglaciecola sp. CAU 1673]MDF2180357.1 alpha/beta fold hydrolase [Aliiglaciecola sp. CAU 1673]
MKFNYLNESTNPLTLLLRAITGGISRLSPRLSGYLGSKLLMSPHSRRQYRFDSITPSNEIILDTRLGKVHINLFGQGERLALLSHGWGDNSRVFQQLIGALLAKGYKVASIDHVGHGKSEGKRAHLPAFIDTLSVVIQHFEDQSQPVDALVGHSMSGMAMLNLPSSMLQGRKVFLLAVPVDFFTIMFRRVEKAGISPLLLTRVLEFVTRQYGLTWQQLHSDNHKDKLHEDVVFIHDKDDKYAPFDDTARYVAQSRARLLETKGAGHSRILVDNQVIDNIIRSLPA